MTTIDRPHGAVREPAVTGQRAMLETILIALAPLIPYVLPVGGLAFIVYAGFLVAPALGYAVAGLAMLVLDWQIRSG